MNAKSTISRWRKGIYALIVLLLVFTMLEGVSRIFCVRDGYEDPFLGFTSNHPVFMEKALPDGSKIMKTAPEKLAFFNLQTFDREKDKDCLRILCLGGSTVFGRPFDDRLSFCAFLREALTQLMPGRKVEVINAGGISYASYRCTKVLQQLLPFNLDLVILCTGHNEFLEERSYPQLSKRPAWLMELSSIASYSTFYNNLTSRLFPPQQMEIPDSVHAILDNPLGLSEYRRDESYHQQVLTHFKKNLAGMARMCSEAEVPMIMVRPGVNLSACAPFKSAIAESYSLQEKELIERTIHELSGLSDQYSLRVLKMMLAKYPEYAEGWYRYGKASLALGNEQDARKAFEKALQEDLCPLRMKFEFAAAMLAFCKEEGIPCLDVDSRLRLLSEQGSPGDKEFWDHVHPRPWVHVLMARWLMEIMKESGLVSWQAEPFERVFLAIQASLASRIDAKERGAALMNLAKVMGWSGKTRESYQLAKEAISLAPQKAEAHYLGGVNK